MTAESETPVDNKPTAESPSVDNKAIASQPIVAEKPTTESPSVDNKTIASQSTVAEKPTVNQSPEYAKIRCKHFKSENNIVCGGLSYRGTDHVNKDLPCQDYCGYELSTEYSVFAVSDGHGSVKYSQFGSQIAVAAVKDVIKNCNSSKDADYPKYIDTDIIRYFSSNEGKKAIIKVWKDKVLNHWANKNQANQGNLNLTEEDVIDQYGATLLVLIVLKHSIITCTVGDGALKLITQSKDEVVSVIKDDDEGVATESTLSLSHLRWDFLETKLFSREDFKYALISTDGISKSYQNGLDNIAKEFAKSIDQNIELFKQDMFDTMDAMNPQIGDDITLMVVKF